MRFQKEYSGATLGIEKKDFFAAQGILAETPQNPKWMNCLENAWTLFLERAYPIGILSEVSVNEFADIYHGDGFNQLPAPLPEIFPMAKSLAIFVVTLGEEISRAMKALSRNGDFPTAHALDSLASIGAEKTADALQQDYLDRLVRPDSDHQSLIRYSPGYCGWHLSGQRKLFEFLQPVEIGVSLRSSFLMEPLKSISGVFICGAKEIHEISVRFPFCKGCLQGCSSRNRSEFPSSTVANSV